MQLTITRKFRLFAWMCRTKVIIMTETGEEIEKLFLWGGQTKMVTLSNQRYILKVSTFIPLARPVEGTAICYGDRLDEIYIEVETVNFNILANLIPGLGFSVPIFEYKITFQNVEMMKNGSRMQKLCSMLMKSLGRFFGFFAIYFYLLNLSAAYDIGTDMVWALKGTDAYTLYTYEVVGELMGCWIFPILCLILARFCFRLSRRLLRRRRDVTLRQNVMPPFILYLRSFDADAVTAKPADGILKPEQTEEQLLVAILDDIAPVIAIGIPGDSYLPDGAARLYVSDDEWQDQVMKLAVAAEFVVLRLGDTEGFWWEVDFCLDRLSPDKLLFVIPAMKGSMPLVKLEDRLQIHGINASLSCLNPKKRSKSSISGFFAVQDDGQSSFMPLRHRRLLYFFIPAEDVLREPLFNFLRKHGGYVKRHSIAVRAWVTWLMTFFLVFIMGANSYLKFRTFEQNRFPKELIVQCESSLYSQEQMKGLSNRGKVYRIFIDIFLGANELDEQSVVELYHLTTVLLEAMSDREYQLLVESLPDEIPAPTDLLIVAKRYFTDYAYNLYLSYLEQTAAAGYAKPQVRPDFEQLAPDIQAELQNRLEQLPCYDEHDGTLSDAHCYYVEYRKVLMQMYEEGYEVESLLRAGLIF